VTLHRPASNLAADFAKVGVTLAQIVDRLGGELKGDATTRILRIAPLDVAQSGDISFLSNPKYARQLAETRASAVILTARSAVDCALPAIVTTQPYLYFAYLAQWLTPAGDAAPGVHASATVATAIPASVSVGPGASIGRDAKIGEQVQIGAGVVIGEGVEIGAASRIHPNVTIYPGCRIGQRAIVHAGAVIGADGFGFAQEQDKSWVKIPQNGRVIIGDDVEIGANTTIDRGALEDTLIGDGVKLDNQIQVGHNVHIGAHSAMAGCVGIAGSARIGRRCTVGGGTVILGHLTICDDVQVSAGTLVAKSILKPGNYTGTVPSLPHEDWLKNFSHLRHLDAMADKIRALESRIAQLENKS
jgi:UDP-3-O-[3-hydroxymyristoyl] glucosamine N-acyltransferase